MRQTIIFIALILFLSCKRKSINSKHIKKINHIEIFSSQNDTIIKNILNHKDILNHISFTYKYGHNHIIIDSKIIFKNKNIEIDTMLFSLSKDYKTDKDIVIKIDSINSMRYNFIVYYKNGNNYYNGFVKKIHHGMYWSNPIMKLIKQIIIFNRR